MSMPSHESGLYVSSPSVDDDEEYDGLSGDQEVCISDSTLNVALGISVLLQFALLVAKVVMRGTVNDAKHESHDPMHVVDTVMYSVMVLRNVCIIHFIRRHVPEHMMHPQYFSVASLTREAFFGPTAEIMLELTLGAVIGVSLEIVAFQLTFTKLGPAYGNYVMQSVNFMVLFVLILVTDRSWARLHVVCRWQQIIQVMLIVYDIVLHSITMTKPGMNHDFRDLRMASLASLIAIRVISFRVFSFKAHNPTLSYVSPLHSKLAILEDSSLV